MSFMVNCTSSFLFTVVMADGSKWAAANTSFIWASFCSRRSLRAVSFFSSKTFFSPIFCCSSNIAVTNRLCKSSRSCCSWNNMNFYVQYTDEAQYSFRTNEIWNLTVSQCDSFCYHFINRSLINLFSLQRTVYTYRLSVTEVKNYFVHRV